MLGEVGMLRKSGRTVTLEMDQTSLSSAKQKPKQCSVSSRQQFILSHGVSMVGINTKVKLEVRGLRERRKDSINDGVHY